MKPVDPRLLRNAAAARIFILAAAALGVLAAVLIIAQADLLARVITNAFLGHAAISAAVTPLALLTLVVVGRAVVAWLSESAAHRASTSVIAQLRAKVVDHVLRVGPRDVDRSPAEVANLATRGLDGLDGYFARYMPQLLLATVVPLAVGARILFADWVSAIIVACTIPLIPIFMILIGLYTRRDVSRQWRTLSVLANHFVDLIAGLSVLTAFGRAREQRRTIREVTEKYRGQTMRTLRVAFLSSMVLDLLATLSVACIAVAIGLRLVYGYMDLQTGLVVLILAPEVYLPLRAVGTRFHDSAEGVAAADEVFKLLESTAEVPGGHVPAPDPSKAPVTLSDIRVDGRSGPILDGLSMDIAPGEVVGVVGPSGAGKTTLLDLLLTWRRPDAGEITIGGAPLSELDRAAWLARIAWVPQQPRLVAGRVIDNLRLGAPNATDEQVRAAAEAAALDVPLDRPVGELGAGLSTGQQRRVALARALLADRPLLLLDEPTEGVDAATERAIVNALPGMLAGRSAVIVTHHPALLRLCDRVVTIAGRAPEPVPTTAPEETENLMSATPRTVVFSEDADGADQFGTDQMGTDDLVPGGADKDGGTSPWHWLADAVRPYRKRVVVATAWGSAALAGGVAMISCSAWLITKSALEPPILSLMIAIGAVQFFGIGKSMVRYMERLASHDAALRVLADLRVRIWEALAKLGPTLTSRLRRGDLLSRLMADVDAQQDVLVRGLVPGLSAGVVGILTSIVMALLNAPSGATLLVALIVAGVAAPLLTVATGKLAERRTAASKAAVLAGTMELLQAAPDLLAFGAADARRSTLRRSDAELTSALGRSAWARGAGDGLGTLAIGLATVACTWFGVLALHAGQLSGPVLAVLALTPLATADLVLGLPEAAQRLLGAGDAVRRLARLENAPAVRTEPVEPVPVPATRDLVADGLAVRWPGAVVNAVSDVDLAIGPGKRLALTGPSGAGKTTVLAALMRDLDPSAGSVRADGVNTLNCVSEDVRSRIAWCGPDTHLFDSSLRENLKLANHDADDDRLVDVLRQVRLGDWFDGLPEGLDTRLGAHGTGVSGGERQRLGLARALVADRPVVLLDEPTAHLDEPTAQALMDDLLTLTEDRAALIVTHRPGEIAGQLPVVELPPANQVARPAAGTESVNAGWARGSDGGSQTASESAGVPSPASA